MARAALLGTLLFAAMAAVQAAPPRPHLALTCPPSIIDSVVSCTGSGTVAAGGRAGWWVPSVPPPLAPRATPPFKPGWPQLPPLLRPLPADANVTYAFSVEESAATTFDLVLTLRTHSGDADLCAAARRLPPPPAMHGVACPALVTV